MKRIGKSIVIIAAAASLSANAQVLRLPVAPASVQCPSIMEVKIDKDAHPGWWVYSNNPLRLTSADIMYVDVEEALLDPETVEKGTDGKEAMSSIFNLEGQPPSRELVLICHYGIHAELRRSLSKDLKTCRFTRFRQWDVLKGASFEATCN